MVARRVPAVISPEQAVAYVRELSADVRAVLVLDAAGAPLAGPPALADPARDLLALLGPPPSELVARLGGPPRAPRARRAATADAGRGGVVFAAADGRHALVALAGPLSLTGPTALDVRAALAALSSPPAPAGPAAPPPVPRAPDSALDRAMTALLAVA